MLPLPTAADCGWCRMLDDMSHEAESTDSRLKALTARVDKVSKKMGGQCYCTHYHVSVKSFLNGMALKSVTIRTYVCRSVCCVCAQHVRETM